MIITAVRKRLAKLITHFRLYIRLMLFLRIDIPYRVVTRQVVNIVML